MPREVHAIVRNAKNFDHVVRMACDSEENEMSPAPRKMQGIEPRINVAAFIHADDGRAALQKFESIGNRDRIATRLF